MQENSDFKETTVLPDSLPEVEMPVEEPRERERPRQERRSSGLMAGLAIGAIVGAIAGGATAAVVSANVNPANSAATFVSQGNKTVIESSGEMTAVTAIAQAATESVVTIEVAASEGVSTGSGVIYSTDGYIITNAHVVTSENSTFADTKVRVFLSDGTIFSAVIVGSDPYADIAVIKINAENLPAVSVASSESIAVGDLAVAIGAPFNLSNTVTSGVVSTLYRGITVGSPLLPSDGQEDENSSPWNFNFELPGRGQSQVAGQVTLPVIQTDADINPGNSGGALLNRNGELIGINVAIASTGANTDSVGSVGLGFAIPSNLATRVADSLINGEVPSHGLLGATVEDSRGQERSSVRGGLVREITRGGAADAADIRPGDIIVSVGQVATFDGTAVSAMVRYFESGSIVEVGINRAGEQLVKEVELGALS